MATRRPTRTRAARRETVWFEFGYAEFDINGASTASLLFSLNAAALALRPFTIVRTRGFYYYRSNQIIAIEDYGGSFGMAVVSDQSVAVGVTAVPTPVTDFGSDLWFDISSVSGQLNVGDATGIQELGKRQEIDSKAMRRVDVGQDVIVAAETYSTSESFFIGTAFRMLVKLH